MTKLTSITSALDHTVDQAIRKIYKWFIWFVIKLRVVAALDALSASLNSMSDHGTNRPTWDEYGMILAQAVRLRAACSRRQVGAVILDENHRVVSTGYNGVPAGLLNCSDGGCPRGLLSYNECAAYGSYSNCSGFHAERNAIETAREVRALNLPVGAAFLTGCTIYVTHDPCEDCSQRIMEAGITRVISPNSRG